MADEMRDPGYWRRARDEMNAFHAAKKAEFDALGRRRRELLEQLRAEQNARKPGVIDIRWNSVAVPATSGAGGSTVTVAPPVPARGRKRWRWF